jgi:hypothetical protein
MAKKPQRKKRLTGSSGLGGPLGGGPLGGGPLGGSGGLPFEQRVDTEPPVDFDTEVEPGPPPEPNPIATLETAPDGALSVQPSSGNRVLRLEPGKYNLAPVTLARRKPVVIRSKAQVIRESGLLITVLEEALRYRPDPRRNSPPPEIWHQLNLEDRAAFQLISELVAELKKLNEFLGTQGRATTQSKVVRDLQKVGLAVLNTYGKTVAVGAGLLTIGLLCTLLQHIGAGDVVEKAMLWKRIGH